MTEVRAHPRFSRVGFYNDIAVLVLDRPVRKSKYVIPVCLPAPSVIPSKERLAGEYSDSIDYLIQNQCITNKKFTKYFNLKVEEQVLLVGEQLIMGAKSQQCSGKQNYRFGEMKTVIVLIFSRSLTIFYVLDIVKEELMLAREIVVSFISNV